MTVEQTTSVKLATFQHDIKAYASGFHCLHQCMREFRAEVQCSGEGVSRHQNDRRPKSHVKHELDLIGDVGAFTDAL